MATWGWPVKSGVEATNATTLTTRFTRSRSPISALTAAIAFSAHCCAHATASSGLTSAPTLPVAISSPERIGSWPEVKTWLPERTAGTYAATGRATSGTARPSSASRSSTALMRGPRRSASAASGSSGVHASGRLK